MASCTATSSEVGRAWEQHGVREEASGERSTSVGTGCGMRQEGWVGSTQMMHRRAMAQQARREAPWSPHICKSGAAWRPLQNCYAQKGTPRARLAASTQTIHQPPPSRPPALPPPLPPPHPHKTLPHHSSCPPPFPVLYPHLDVLDAQLARLLVEHVREVGHRGKAAVGNKHAAELGLAGAGCKHRELQLDGACGTDAGMRGVWKEDAGRWGLRHGCGAARRVPLGCGHERVTTANAGQ
eukprot:355328-Chlamydomonas_euryale.AAC.2